ncbi:MAG: flagella basal body P-ring formation protein FlgA [Sphingopyxis sp.]
MAQLPRLFGFAIAACLAATGYAQTGLQDLDALDTAIRDAVAQHGDGATVAPLDRRLRLQPCAQRPEISGPQLGAMIVTCPSAGWRIRVAVMNASANASQAVVQSRPPLVATPMIRRGDQVQLLLQGRNFAVRATGIAEQDGAIGQRIRVRNERRTGIFTGLVQNDGTIFVNAVN